MRGEASRPATRSEKQRAFPFSEIIGGSTPAPSDALLEAERNGGTLDAVGDRIVAETFHRAIEGSDVSILQETPATQPALPSILPTTPPSPQPTLADGAKVNLFCSGHAFLPDGRLLVVSGHLFDGAGVNQASLYDPASNTWTPTALMNNGRWYPTAITLPDGLVLVLSDSFRQGNQTPVNDVLQAWEGGDWSPIINTVGEPLNFIGLPLYPRMHVASDGRVFMSGPLEQTFLLHTSGGGEWTPLPNPGGKRANGFRDCCPVVVYDVDKVIYIGGGNDQSTHEPTAAAEVIDLSLNPPRWRATQPMKFRRRQHTAVRLPDATVLSAGGGEYRPDNINANDPKDSKRNAQIFSPLISSKALVRTSPRLQSRSLTGCRLTWAPRGRMR